MLYLIAILLLIIILSNETSRALLLGLIGLLLILSLGGLILAVVGIIGWYLITTSHIQLANIQSGWIVPIFLFLILFPYFGAMIYKWYIERRKNEYERESGRMVCLNDKDETIWSKTESIQSEEVRQNGSSKHWQFRIPDGLAGIDWLAKYAKSPEHIDALTIGPRVVLESFEGFNKGAIVHLHGIGRKTCYLNGTPIEKAIVAAKTSPVDELGIRVLE